MHSSSLSFFLTFLLAAVALAQSHHIRPATCCTAIFRSGYGTGHAKTCCTRAGGYPKKVELTGRHHYTMECEFETEEPRRAETMLRECPALGPDDLQMMYCGNPTNPSGAGYPPYPTHTPSLPHRGGWRAKAHEAKEHKEEAKEHAHEAKEHEHEDKEHAHEAKIHAHEAKEHGNDAKEEKYKAKETKYEDKEEKAKDKEEKYKAKEEKYRAKEQKYKEKEHEAKQRKEDAKGYDATHFISHGLSGL